MTDHQGVVRIPFNHWIHHFLDPSKISLSQLREILCRALEDAKENGENSCKNAKEIEEIVKQIEREKSLQDPRKCFNDQARDVFKDFDIESLTSDKAKVGVSSLVGYLFNLGLVDVETLESWMTELKEDGSNFIRWNLMEIVKEKVQNLTKVGIDDETLKRVYEAIKEEKFYDNSFRIVHVNTEEKIQKMMNTTIDELVKDPSTLLTPVLIYRQMFAMNKTLEETFNEAMDERLDGIENPSSLYINITWIESLRAEITNRPATYIEGLAERILFTNRERNIIFVLILHKLSTRLRRDAPEVFDRCVGYLRQLLGILPTGAEFWLPNESHIEEDLRSKLYHKQLESFNFKVDDFSLDRAKFIFMKAFEERDYIAKALARMENNLAVRLLKTHLGILCGLKVQTEKLEFNVGNELDVKCQKTSKFIRLVAKFYEFDIINNQTIISVHKFLIEQKNFSVLLLLSVMIGEKAKEDQDPMFELTKKFILQLCDTNEKQEEEKERTSSSNLPIDLEFKFFLNRLSRGESTIESFDFKLLNQTHLKSCASFLVSKASSDSKLLLMAPQICQKIQKVQPQFKKVLMDVFNENFTQAFLEFGDGVCIQKFEPKAVLMTNLAEKGFLDVETTWKIVSTCRKILQKTKSIESWKSFLNILKSFLEIELSIDFMAQKDFVELLDFLFNIAINNSKPSIVHLIRQTLSKLDKLLEPTINASYANPSFKIAVAYIKIKGNNEKRETIEIPHRVGVKNPKECAKYFVENAVKSNKYHVTKFLDVIQSLANCPDSHQVEELIPQIVTLLIEKFHSQHIINRKSFDDYDEAISTQNLALNLFASQLMSVEAFKECLNMITDSMSEGENLKNKMCFHEMALNAVKSNALTRKPGDYYYEMIHIIGRASALTGNDPKDNEEVTDRILTFDDLKRKSPEAQAKMIVESVFKVKDASIEVWENYRKIFVKLSNKKFKEEMEKRIEQASARLVCAPYVKNFKWKEISRFGLFISCLYQHRDITYEQFESFVENLSRRIIAEKKVGCRKMFAKFYIEIAKNYPRTMEEENIRHLDYICCIGSHSDDEMKKLAKVLLEMFHKTLKVEDKNPKVYPSMKYFIDNVVYKGCDDHTYPINGNDSDESARYFIKHALLFPYSRLKFLCKYFDVLSVTTPTDDRYNNTNLMFNVKFTDSLVKECSKIFNEEFKDPLVQRERENSRRAIGITKLIAELYLIKRFPYNHYNNLVVGISNFIMNGDTTMCHLMCFHNMVIAVGDRLSKGGEKHPKIGTINRIRKFYEETIQGIEMRFDDAIIDEIDSKEIL